MKTRIIAALLILCVAAVPLQAGNIEKELKGVIDDMIEYLEKMEHQAFVEKYMPPQILEAAKKDGELESIVNVFIEKKADKLLEHLKRAKKLKPEIKDENNAVYNAEGFYLPIKLIKIGDRWYLK